MADITYGYVTDSSPRLNAIRFLARQLVHQVGVWRKRARGRAELARMGRRELQDLALTPGHAAMEANKPFWAP